MEHDDALPPLDLERVAEAALQLAAERDLASAVRRFLEAAHQWASPSAVLAAVREPGGDPGWRLLPALCQGSASLGAERWIARLVEDEPRCLSTPTLLAGQEVPGARVRDNWAVPWSFEDDSGLLLLRGVPRPQPAHLGAALALLAVPLWPRLLGGPAERVEAMVVALREAAVRLEAEAARQADRLQALRPSGLEEATARVASLEAELEAVRLEMQSRGEDMLRERAGAALRETEAGAALAAAEARARAAEEALERSTAAGGADEAEAGALGRSLASAQDALASSQQQRAQLEQELADRAESHLAEVQAAQSAAAAQVQELQAAVASAEAARAAALQAALAADQAREQAEHERGRAQEALAAIEQQLREAVEARAADEDRRLAAERERRSTAEEETALRQALESAQRERAHSAEALALAREQAEAAARKAEELASRLEDVERERSAAIQEQAVQRQSLESAQQAHTLAEEALAVVRSQAEEAQRVLNELRDRLFAAEQARVASAEEARALRAQQASTLAELQAARSEAERARAGASELGALADPARTALAVARRTAFVPSGLRLAMDDLEAALGARSERPAVRARIAILDRDLGGLGTLVDELEATGVEALVANYAEELALLLKTPTGRDVVLAVCDVMAFRPEHNVPSLLHGWERDRPGLALYLSATGDSAVEQDRLRRVPSALIVGQVSRPLAAARVVELVEAVLRRQARS